MDRARHARRHFSLGSELDDVSGRSVPYLLGIEANWRDPADDGVNLAWARGCAADLRDLSAGGWYLNFPGLDEGGEAAMRQSFGAKYARLAAVKRKYDPGNLFRLNQNIKPA
jgi:hypothetical protein